MHQPKSDLELLAVAQHHGLPTRLLDWTESLLVAAYFAIEKADTEVQRPEIIAVCDLPILNGDEDPFKLSRVSVYRPPHISPRIPAQRAVFTVHPNPDTYSFNNEHAEIYALRSKSNSFLWLKQILDSCAINKSSLFPDLDGLAEYTAWRHKWGMI